MFTSTTYVESTGRPYLDCFGLAFRAMSEELHGLNNPGLSWIEITLEALVKLR